MKIVPIFAQDNDDDLNKGLFSVHYDDEELDEMDNLITKWFDIKYLYEFFEKHSEDLSSDFFKDKEITISKAVSSTRQEAHDLFDKLQENSKKGKLSNLFTNLHKEQDDTGNLIQRKTKSKTNHRWLRIYAIKISDDTYIITGGGIKLVKKMQERQHLIDELEKIKKVRRFLIEKGVSIQEDFDSYIIL